MGLNKLAKPWRVVNDALEGKNFRVKVIKPLAVNAKIENEMAKPIQNRMALNQELVCKNVKTNNVATIAETVIQCNKSFQILGISSEIRRVARGDVLLA